MRSASNSPSYATREHAFNKLELLVHTNCTSFNRHPHVETNTAYIPGMCYTRYVACRMSLLIRVFKMNPFGCGSGSARNSPGQVQTCPFLDPFASPVSNLGQHLGRSGPSLGLHPVHLSYWSKVQGPSTFLWCTELWPTKRCFSRSHVPRHRYNTPQNIPQNLQFTNHNLRQRRLQVDLPWR